MADSMRHGARSACESGRSVAEGGAAARPPFRRRIEGIGEAASQTAGKLPARLGLGHQHTIRMEYD